MTSEQTEKLWLEKLAVQDEKNDRFSELMDRLEKFLDKQEQQPVPEVIPQPIELVHPEDLDEVLEEMATSGLISAPQMRRIVNAVRPILEENARLKAGL